ncbi:MAG: ATP-grasp ribosomal peptide maturase [Actinomadura sp.]
MSEKTVLILTDESDRTADRVAAELDLRGTPVARLDAAWFPAAVRLTARIGAGRPWSGRVADISTDRRLVDLSDVAGVYYRRPTQFTVDERMSGPERLFAYAEARRGFGGVLQALAGCLWVNDPVAAARCEYKPVQLAAATVCGLRIPETIITSDPRQAHAWASRLGRPIIYKPLGGIWHADEGQVRVLYTAPVEDPDELLDEALATTAHLFQERIQKTVEARAVVVGERIFATAIDAHSDRARVDWRSDYDALTYRIIDLPGEVATGLVELHRRLGLGYGAADLICDESGRWYFLETNQAGEWGWLADAAGVEIAVALADLLTASSR